MDKMRKDVTAETGSTQKRNVHNFVWKLFGKTHGKSPPGFSEEENIKENKL
jgi:hypothetical protein